MYQKKVCNVSKVSWSMLPPQQMLIWIIFSFLKTRELDLLYASLVLPYLNRALLSHLMTASLQMCFTL